MDKIMDKPSLTIIGALAMACFSTGVAAFTWSEATIEDLHQALNQQEITCEDVVKGYLKRIDAFDKTGPDINSIITVNPKALSLARERDKQQDKHQALFCVPVVVKDNINTKDMPTSLGSSALKESRPPTNAVVVDNLINEGAIILAKANLDEFAIAMLGLSSAGGQTRNPYILTNGPGGSSGGTGSAVSASLAMVGLGTDTGGSIRIPAAVAGLTGIRPSRALADLRGVAPLSITQDTVGPMCRKVADCARILQFTEAWSTPERKQQIRDALARDGLKGARIALIAGMFPEKIDTNQPYHDVIDNALKAMRSAGATIDIVVLPEQEEILSGFKSLAGYEIKEGLNHYLTEWPSDKDAHIRSYDQIFSSKGYAPTTEEWLTLYNKLGNKRYDDPVYRKNIQGRQGFIRAQLNRVMNGNVRYDAVLYPTITELNVPIGQNTEGRKNVSLSSFSGLPAVSFIAGMTAGDNPQPVALEFLGREFSEPELISLVSGYELHHPVRVAPKSTPELKTFEIMENKAP
ncbi:amidase [Pragia fontium]|uniref:Amidase n=2 Tax=Pragia fontium TaxID=82985 RepID=A0ABQ5LLB2_9GAMM|nr:amidase [Pragia fontium]